MTYFLGGVTGQDDPLNASTLGAPAIIRGTIYAHQIAGLVIGAGQTTQVRQSNATILQTAINYACSNGKILVMEPGIYEINSSTGLTIPAQGAGNYGLVLRGSRTGTIISQFYNTTPSAPVLTIGDTTGVTLSSGVDISGLTLKHGVSQTGFTSAHGLVVGFCANGRISDISISNTTNPSYNGISFSSYNYAMAFSNISISGFQNIGLNFLATDNTGQGPINHFSCIEVDGGAPFSYSAVTNFMAFSSGSYNDLLFNALSLRWGACNTVCPATSGGVRGLTINGLHMEGIKLTGANPTFFDMSGDYYLFNGFTLRDPVILAANYTGSPFLFRDWSGGGSTVEVNNFTFIATGAANANIDSNFGLMTTTSGALFDSSPILEISKFQCFDLTPPNIIGHVFADVHMPIANFSTPLAFHRYSRGHAASKIDRALLNISATYTHYGSHEDATIVVPASITSFTLTLATTMAATGTQKPRTGNTVRVRRASGTAAGTLTVAFGGTGTPTTNTTSAVDLFYQFDGTNWQTFTQVT